jgi:hypothetical protein
VHAQHSHDDHPYSTVKSISKAWQMYLVIRLASQDHSFNLFPSQFPPVDAVDVDLASVLC